MRFSFFLVAALLLTVVGCSTEPTGTESTHTNQSQPTSNLPSGEDQAVEPTAAAGSITVAVVDGPGLKAAIEAHRGKVVLVDFWATWCHPCVARFPHIVELSRKHAADGLAVISMSLNDPSEQELVLEFLRKQDASFDNLISEFGVSTRTSEAFDLRGDVPFYRLYGRDGQLAYQFSPNPDGLENCETVEQLDLRLQELLSDQSGHDR